MKHLSRFLVASLLIMVIGSVNAQDKNNPWAINVGANAIDTYPVGDRARQAGTNLEIRGGLFEEFYNVNDHWNILPSVSYINISRYVGDGFVVGVTGTLNRIDKLGDSSPVNELQQYAVDGAVSYSLKEVIGSTWFDPYLTAGAGYTWLDSQLTGGTPGFGTANGGAGVRFWLSENFNVGFQSIYKHVFEDNGPLHFQHSASVGFAFGGKDTDGDGIYDKDDACPEVAGTVANKGCPEVSVEVLNDLNVQIKSVLFDYNAATVRAESYTTLDNVAKIMDEYPTTRFLIEGHTDDRGRDAYNLNLSDQRAASVRSYLTGKGIAASRLESKGFGEARPVASNKTAAGRQENRRVELSIIDK